jgi:5-methylcytosine-specific restriction endonuclease McrA
VRRRADVSGRPFYQRQCLNCGDGIGSAVSAAIALADGQTPPPFDESIGAKKWLEADRLREKRRTMRAEVYASYLQTETRRAKRDRALTRDNRICQGCLLRAATQVHHLTYAHIGAELLFELVSLCDECHERTHAGSTALDDFDD